jgi:hypothetical protein
MGAGSWWPGSFAQGGLRGREGGGTGALRLLLRLLREEEVVRTTLRAPAAQQEAVDGRRELVARGSSAQRGLRGRRDEGQVSGSAVMAEVAGQLGTDWGTRKTRQGREKLARRHKQ